LTLGSLPLYVFVVTSSPMFQASDAHFSIAIVVVSLSSFNLYKTCETRWDLKWKKNENGRQHGMRIGYGTRN
jgi:hypothetical protein